MAIVQPFAPNLSGAYGNIQDALRTGAEIASKNQGPMGAAAAVVQPLGEMAKERAQMTFKAGIEDKLNQNKEYYKALSEGKTMWQQDDVDSLIKTHYPEIKPENYPQIGKSGILATPKDIQDLADHGETLAQGEILASPFDKTDATKAALIRFLAHDKNNAQSMALIAGGGKVHYQLDSATGYHVPTDVFGHPVGPPLELQGGSLGADGNLKITDWTKLDPVTKKQVEPAISKAVNDPEISKDISKLYQLQQIKQELNSDNPQAVINVKSETGQAVGQMAPGRMVGRIMEQEDIDPTAKAKAVQWFTTHFGSGALSDTNKQEGLALLRDTETQIRQRVDANVSAKGQDINNTSGGKLDSAAARKLASSKWDQFQQQYPAETTATTKINVKRISDGQTGTIDAKDFDPKKYKKI